jgi:hypothetical protein
MFKRVEILRVVEAGMITVLQSCIAFRKWGESSPPLALKVQLFGGS